MARPTLIAPPRAPRPTGEGEPLPAGPRPPVHELVAEFARADPARTAVSSGASTITYGDLDDWAADIEAMLTEAGVDRGGRVGVLVEPSLGMVAAALGAMRCGAAYVPVDVSHPDARVTDILLDAQVDAVLVTDTSRPRLTGLDAPLVLVDTTSAARERRAGPPGGAARSREPDSPGVLVAADEAAYLIYTSGSTGEPKGVVVEHGQLAASTLARRTVYPGRPVFLLVSPLAFDSSVAGLWGTLTAGGHLVVATPDEVRDPERLVELIEHHRVTQLLCVPSLYSVLLDAARSLGGRRLSSLETVVVAGEPLPPELVDRHFALRTSPTELVNEYGPTEATVWASYQRFVAPGPVSIGRAIPGARLYLLDDRLRPVPPGAEGELFIGGAGVSRGYHGRPDATARAFLDDPFAATPGARMYRTGDRARWNADGTLAFLGRRDHQVKVRGHRVELPVIERQLADLPGVREAVVVLDAVGTSLTGFVLAASDSPPDPDTLREQLAVRLPAVMVPARIVCLDAFPRTVNGKADRAALQARADERPATATTAPAVQGDLAAQVAAAWAEVLKASHVPLDVNFFDLGGHSLAMFQLREALETHTGKRPPVIALFKHTTVAAQVAMLRDGSGSTEGADGIGSERRAAARRARALRARRQDPAQEAAT
ncbi:MULTISPECIES: non-ribosomal peptide synthetase [unclassified Streptomyces]|uniref:non-ribosomal peptide synthetase n=1 Tax=unclassified Streptomyces TaxID=2593676 RepID=UPI00158792AC|nr:MULTISPECIES: non-ribosomal peptide synthetase [unclassified Streptomyces]NUV69290.1 non-ribosomal peptide synthetase [Streptomyces sp. CAI-121]NUW00934.1 non-ribosomal peptide synthetase [Streptomyces sp. CAI 127]NUW15433.1 non-ribosomal peptide synthetase [Streptomyces sp. CAI-68]